MGTDSYSRYTAGGPEGSAAPSGPVDCVGASKGLFCGLLLLVTALICLILFFVLIAREKFKWLAIYLADCSHAGLLLLSFLATLIGFIRYLHPTQLLTTQTYVYFFLNVRSWFVECYSNSIHLSLLFNKVFSVDCTHPVVTVTNEYA